MINKNKAYAVSSIWARKAHHWTSAMTAWSVLLKRFQKKETYLLAESGSIEVLLSDINTFLKLKNTSLQIIANFHSVFTIC